MSTIIDIQATDYVGNSRTDINTNFSNLNTDKAELGGNNNFSGNNNFELVPTTSATPTQPEEFATVAYANTIASGFQPRAASNAATTEPLPTNSYDNGVLGVGATLTADDNGEFPTIDGISITTSTGSNMLLVKNETNEAHNGVYALTDAGSLITPWVLTRATSWDSSSELAVGATTFVIAGDDNGNKQFTQLTTGTITVGVSNITFGITNQQTVYTASNGVLLTGTNFTADLKTNDGLVIKTGQIGVDYDNSTIGIVTNKLAVKAGGITNNEIANTTINLTQKVTGTLPAPNGGTGNAVYAVGDLLYASTTTALSRRAAVATGNALISAGVNTAPTWGKIGLTTHVSGVLPAANGGTAQSTYALGDILYSSATNTLAKLAGNTTSAMRLLTQTGTGTVSAAPAWNTITTILNTLSSSQGAILYRDASNWVALAPGTNGQVLQTQGAGANPQWATAGSGTVTSVSGTTNRITSTGGATPVIDISASYVGQSSITTLGTISTGTWGATTIAVDKGGTGQTSYTNGQLLIGNTTGNTLAKATLTGTANQVIVTNGAGSITLGLPQDLAATSSPQFVNLTLENPGAATPGITLRPNSELGTEDDILYRWGTDTGPTYNGFPFQIRWGNPDQSNGYLNFEDSGGNLPYFLNAGGYVGDGANLTNLNAGAITSGTLPLNRGGTNASLTAVNGGIVYSTASAMAISAAGSSGQILRSAGAATPVWSTATFPNTATTSGAYMRADGTNWITSTLVLPNAATANRLVYATSTNTYGESANLTFDGATLAVTGQITGTYTTTTVNQLTSGQSFIYSSSGADTSGAVSRQGTNVTVTDANTWNSNSGTKTVTGLRGAATANGTTQGTNNNRTVYGVVGSATNTGVVNSGTNIRDTFGGNFTALGDTNGVATAYGVYATASGADTNWAGYFNAGNVYVADRLLVNSTTDQGYDIYVNGSVWAANEMRIPYFPSGTGTGSLATEGDIVLGNYSGVDGIGFNLNDTMQYINATGVIV